MSDMDDELGILNELEGIVNNASKDIIFGWQQLQVDLLVSSKEMTDEIFDKDSKVKAVLCVGYGIGEEQYDDHSNGIEYVGPDKQAYVGLSSGNNTHYCRMTPAVGVNTTKAMVEFLNERSYICSLFNKTDYISLLLHAKFEKSEFLAMTTPAGICILLDKPNEPQQSFYLDIDDNDATEDGAKGRCFTALNTRQREMVAQLVVCQNMPRLIKEKQPKLWALMIGAMDECGSNPFDKSDEEDTD